MIKIKDLAIYRAPTFDQTGEMFVQHQAVGEPQTLGNCSDIAWPWSPAFTETIGDWAAEHYDELIERYFPQTRKWLTQDEFVQTGGCCPVCRSVDGLDWDEEAGDFETITLNITCLDCDATFKAHYHLAAYSDVE
jgi:hypothetical protein